MIATEFVKSLEAFEPQYHEFVEILKRQGLEDEHIEMTVNEFYLKRRSNVEVSAFDNAITDLIANYQTDSGFYVGVFGFNDEAYAEGGRIYIGYVEADPVAISINSGAVEQIHSEEDEVIYSCAASSETFLDALTIAVELFRLRTLGKAKRSDKHINANYVQRCAQAAGGSKYADFYSALL